MDTQSISIRLLKAIALSALAGGFAYGLTAWLAPPSVSAKLVAITIVIIAALAILAPAAILNAVGRNKAARQSLEDDYLGYGFSMTRDEGWND